MSAAPLHRILLAFCALALLSVGLVAPAWAQDPPRDRSERGRGQERQETPRQESRARGQDSLADSVRRFERARGDRVLSAERMQADGRDVNRIKAMDERGRVRAYVDDPQGRGGQPPRRERSRDGDD
ncbi:hypothetical protein E2F46_08665 [Luteimonas aestuarii]|uniref:PepSY domain-containing protein n=1 Tax=Luteimonas aestuarii TaxID=453837 RepID=A0A4R5TSD0_9GAMM|nr:hypothetical protein [Luteimonas aestuarii]TDK24348.1 hypothetical protein E2F46_08665 [Luteimonas aestuarii]